MRCPFIWSELRPILSVVSKTPICHLANRSDSSKIITNLKTNAMSLYLIKATSYFVGCV